jgi:NAD(P)-dependent dehydrogenase (short-subunit alcohol dehydrogenase family)
MPRMAELTLTGKIAVLTGASSGIGEAAARSLATAGMTVVAVARRADRLEALADAVPGVHARVADVTRDADVARLAESVRDEFGACHVLVNNAGISGDNRFESWEDRESVMAIMDVNFFGAVRCMAAFVELLTDSAPARVINVASMAGKLAVGEPAYSASKFALVGFTEALGADWERRGITLTQLNPGFIRTEGFPQTELLANPATARLVGDAGMVADAIVEVARSGARERTVPRWYRPMTTLRHAAAPAFWAAAKRVVP